MTITRFRALLIASFLSLVAALVAGLLPGGYSPALADAYANESSPWLLMDDWAPIALLLTLLAVLTLLAAAVAGFIGLFLLARWGRTRSLSLTLLGLPLYLVLGPILMSPLEAMFTEASALLWGACLALAYYSPVATRIETGAAGS
ncbi:MAG: hypothetical protein JNJ62_15085 [Pseudoxanthomonas mexicana]|nr:hypothetical protein [Pseudoxanthomonas mexicana]